MIKVATQDDSKRFPNGIVELKRTVPVSHDSQEGLNTSSGTDYEFHRELAEVEPIPCSWATCTKGIGVGEKYHHTNYGEYCTECFPKVVEEVVGGWEPVTNDGTHK